MASRQAENQPPAVHMRGGGLSGFLSTVKPHWDQWKPLRQTMMTLKIRVVREDARRHRKVTWNDSHNSIRLVGNCTWNTLASSARSGHAHTRALRPHVCCSHHAVHDLSLPAVHSSPNARFRPWFRLLVKLCISTDDLSHLETVGFTTHRAVLRDETPAMQPPSERAKDVRICMTVKVEVSHSLCHSERPSFTL